MTFLKIIIFFTFFASFGQTEEDYKSWENRIDAGIELSDKGSYEEALIQLNEAYAISQNIFLKNEEEYGETAYELGYTYDLKRNYKKAIPLYLEALNNLRLNNQEQEPYYVETLLRVGTIYGFIGDFDNSIKTLEACLKIIESSNGINNLDYSKTLIKVSIAYKKTGDYDKALKYNELSNEIIKNLLGDNSTLYAQNITGLSQIYIEKGQYDKASQHLNMALSILKNQDQEGQAYQVAIFTMSVLHHNKYEYVKEIALLEEVKKNSKEGEIAFISANTNLSVIYEEIGDYDKALTIALEVVNSTREDDPNYPIRLQNLAYNFTELGEFNKAIETYEKALASCSRIFGSSHPLYAKLIDCIGQLYLINGDLVQAKELFEEALSVLLKNFDEEHSEYGFYLNHYTNTLLDLNQYNEAIELIIKNIEISEANSKTDNLVYYQKQLTLAKAYNKIGKYKDALIILENYSEKIKNKLGNQHADYGDMLKSLWTSYEGLDEIEKAIPIIDSSNNVFISQINKVFKFRSEKEKKSFLNITTQNFDELQSVAYRLNTTNSKLNAINLDNQMMLKGLLLNNSKNLLTELTALNNSEINKKIANYRSTKTVLSNTLNLPTKKRNLDIDSLKILVNNKESELVKLYSTHVNSNINLSKNWRNSQSKLGSDDISIEFSHFNYSKANKTTDSIIYVAYVYKKDWEYPKLIPLFEERQLKIILSKKSPNQLYTIRGSKVAKSINKKAIYDLVWQPLEEYTTNCSNIYYAPSGLLNQISFAALGEDNAMSLSYKYNLVQLSSTSVLTDASKEPNNGSALFIGGINYNYNATPTENYGVIKTSDSTNSKVDSWTYLPGTLKEVDALQTILKNEGGSVSTWTGTIATETNFKSLSGKSPSILHIATHGFFYENINNKKQGISDSNLKNQYRLAEDPLLRSGLIFAGANLKSGNQTDDGILTAMEISNMDLSNTDMVVLSACETGLGDIDGSEGVYGLQRAFKMAGVDIIVMSLWQVPDAETAEFMRLFYKNWTQNIKVKDAFNKTQREMQDKYSKEPEKWAAFVLFE